MAKSKAEEKLQLFQQPHYVIVICQNIYEGSMGFVICEKWFERNELEPTLKKNPHSLGQLCSASSLLYHD